MINFNVYMLCEMMAWIREWEFRAAQEIERGQTIVPENYRAIITNNCNFFGQRCCDWNLQSAINRRERMIDMLNTRFTYNQLGIEFKVWREAIEDDLKYERFYHYRKDKGLLVLTTEADWGASVKAFPSARDDIIHAVDCFASEHDTACVFHLMRVLEHGIRELSAAVNLTFDIQQWQTIIEQIEAQIRDFGDHWKASSTKTEWINFYSQAARHFFFLKDAWRNHVSHNLATYDATAARGAIEHVRDFMNHLSSRLGEPL